MKKIKPSLSKGTRDFLPREVAKRNYIFDTIKSVFRKYGFEQIETPAIERLETLTGKYGEEGDKLLFKILNSGDYLSEVRNQKSEIGSLEVKEITPLISEKGLRYDLTVPLARYVVQHQDDLAFPFKRFHIGPVWRADRPQKGRYQEFYQCDADVIGSTSLLNEVELTKIYAEVFEKLGLRVLIHISSRKFLQGLAKFCGLENSFDQFVNLLDKQDKIGVEQVIDSLNELNNNSGEKLKQVYSLLQNGKSEYHIAKNQLAEYFKSVNSEIGLQGLDEIHTVINQYYYKGKVPAQKLQFTFYLARGLNYYSGIIWEVTSNDIQMGSIASGGRYDNLTEMFGGQNMSGVGISFGIERIYDVMEELNLFPETIAQGVKVLFVPRDKSVEEFAFEQVQQLHDAGIPAEIFLGNVKKQKHFNYVEQKNIAYMVEIGENEKLSGTFRLRNIKTRETENDLNLREIQQRLR